MITRHVCSECSVQRRNQKVVEESPSCLLTPETRRAMQEQCIALCKAVKYRSAGTIEMLADGKQNFYFLEMNTRLQVEHPITELVSGEDLVEHMLWIAAGKPLPERLTSSPCLTAKGWAIESRVYAEDPLRNFLPTIGPLNTYKEPELKTPSEENGNITVRIDTGVCEGATISMFYDPMISKLCTHAPTRKLAIETMETALDQYFISGLVNNVPFLRSIYRNENFRKGNYGTGFIPQEYPNGFHGVQLTKHETLELIASAAAIHHNRLSISKTEEDNDNDIESPEFIVALANPDHVTKAGDAPTKVSELERSYRVLLLPGEEYHEVHITALGAHGHGHKVTYAYIHFYIALNVFYVCIVLFCLHVQTEVLKLAGVEWQNEAPLGRIVLLEEGKKDSSGQVSLEEKEVAVQYEGRASQQSTGPHGGLGAGEKYFLRVYGSQQAVVVRSPQEHALSKHIVAQEMKDTSNFLLCPMPGSLISCSKLLYLLQQL